MDLYKPSFSPPRDLNPLSAENYGKPKPEKREEVSSTKRIKT